MKIAIIGAGALGRIVENILLLNKIEYNFFDDSLKTKINELIDKKNDYQIIIGIGNIKTRIELYEKFKKLGFKFATAIHPSAQIAQSAIIEEGCIIKENAVIEIGAKICANSIIGNNSCICHDSLIGKHSRIAPGVTIAGHVEIGEKCYLAVNVGVDRKIKIGKNSIIASGCTIWKNIPDNSIVKLPNKMVIEKNEQ